MNTILRSLCAVAALLTITAGVPRADVNFFIEDFTTTTKRSNGTSADWNTVGGELKLHPFVPTPVGNFDTPASANSVFIAGNHAYVTENSSTLQVIDISNPASPTLAAAFSTGLSITVDVVVSGDVAYVADYSTGFHAIYIGDPTNPIALTRKMVLAK